MSRTDEPAQSRAILFDLGNTLVDYYRPPEFPAILRECLGNLVRSVGLSDGVVDRDLLPRAVELGRERDDLRVVPLWARLRSLLAAHGGAPEDREDDLCQAFMKPIFATARLDDAAPGVLDELRARGIRTAIVSNTPWGSPAHLWRAELARHELLDRVDRVVFCVEVGWRKPHPAPFRRALELLSVPASRASFVGDDPRWDVAGARSAGLESVLLSADNVAGADRTIRRLEELL